MDFETGSESDDAVFEDGFLQLLGGLEKAIDSLQGEQILTVEMRKPILGDNCALYPVGGEEMYSGVLDGDLEVYGESVVLPVNPVVERVYNDWDGLWRIKEDPIRMSAGELQDRRVLVGDDEVRNYFRRRNVEGAVVSTEARNVLGLSPFPGQAEVARQERTPDQIGIMNRLEELDVYFPRANGDSLEVRAEVEGLLSYGIRLGMHRRLTSRNESVMQRFTNLCKNYGVELP